MVPFAGSAAAASGRGLAAGAGVEDFAAAGFSAVFSAAFGGAACSACFWGAAFSAGVSGALAGAPVDASGALLEDVWVEPLEPLPFSLKYAVHSGPTDPGSFWNWSYISSTSQSLAPKSARGLF